MNDEKHNSSAFLSTLSVPGDVLLNINDWYKRNESRLASFVDSAWLLADALLVAGNEVERLFSSKGWSHIPLRNMPSRNLLEIATELSGQSDEERERILSERIIPFFRKDDHSELKALVSEWTTHFEDRMYVFEDALWAHVNGKYTLAIPTLATQIEGILRNLTNEKDRGNKYLTRFVEVCEGKEQKLTGEASVDLHEILEKLSEYPTLSREERWKDKEYDALRDRVTTLKLRSLFDTKNFRDEDASSTVNRHVICHGMFLKFEEKESLQMFFALDLLHEAVGVYKKNAQTGQTTSATPSMS